MRMILGITLAATVMTAGLVPTLAEANADGAVYAMTNDLYHNEIAVFDRSDDGTLSLRGYYPTGGRGVGDTTEPVDALGSQAPLVLSEDGNWLLAVNAGSNQISLFRVRRNGLQLVDVVDSGGLHPASIAVHGDLVYVLNSGGEGNLTGFYRTWYGRLVQIPGSTRSLDVGGSNPPFFLVSPAQIGIDPDGEVIVVTVKGTDEIRTYPLDHHGSPSATPVITESHGSTPFGFAFDGNGHLVVAEPFGNASPGEPNTSAVSSYRIHADGTLDLISASVENGQTATCWAVTDGRFVFTTNNATDTISSYRIDDKGGLTLFASEGIAAATEHAPVDAALTPDGRFLYNLDAGEGTVSMFRVEANGSLTALGHVTGLPVDAGAVGMAAR